MAHLTAVNSDNQRVAWTAGQSVVAMVASSAEKTAAQKVALKAAKTDMKRVVQKAECLAAYWAAAKVGSSAG